MLDDSATGSVEAFTKQRRNLMVLSVFLFAMDFSGAKVPNALDVGGFHLTFSNPERLVMLMWLALLYFVIRYYQYFDKGRLDSYEKPFSIECHIAQLAFEQSRNDPGSLNNLEINELIEKGYKISTYSRKEDARVPHLTYSTVSLRFEFGRKDNPSAMATKEALCKISRSMYLNREIDKWFSVLVKTPYATEFFVPVLFPLVAAIYHCILIPCAG